MKSVIGSKVAIHSKNYKKGKIEIDIIQMMNWKGFTI